jgi:hypothetical protein
VQVTDRDDAAVRLDRNVEAVGDIRRRSHDDQVPFPRRGGWRGWEI